MPISVTPAIPVISAQNVAPDPVLQPGTVVDAQVLKLLADNFVRIAIAGLSIDVFSEVPLLAGQTLQLAVSQTADGVRLAVVGSNAGAPTAPVAAAVSPDIAPLAPQAPVEVAANSPVNSVVSADILTLPERVAVTVATQLAATQQQSLAPLFANLGAVAVSNSLPPQLQQAVMQVLAQRTNLDPSLEGSDVKSAFQKSGILLEAVLATQAVRPVAAIPDLKAALIVLRQTLSSLSASSPTAQTPGAPTAQSPAGAPADVVPPPNGAAPPAASAAEIPGSPATDAAALLHVASTLAPSISPDRQEILPPLSRVAMAAEIVDINPGRPNAATSPVTAPLKATASAALNLLQETLQGIKRDDVSQMLASAMPKEARGDDVTVHTSTPPPPFRGALPAAQPIAAPSIASNAPLATTVHHLLDDTDAAIARQTLLQVASLPDRVDATGPRFDTTAPRWNFEIPFAMPQGTAMAQFEIARDGGGSEVDAAKRVWRARFSIDIEPAGPVHALVSLSGDQTSVRMWAERPATAAQLRAGAAQLGQALARAELRAGDIVIRDGTPPQAAPAPAGHFLDRAL